MNMEEELSKKIGTLSQTYDNQKYVNNVNYSQIKPQEESTYAESNENKGEQKVYPKAPEENVINVEINNKKVDILEDEKEKKKVCDNEEAPNKNINDLKKGPENKKNDLKKSPENNKVQLKEKQKNKKYYFKEVPKNNEVIYFDYSLLKPLFKNIDFKNKNIILLTTGSYNPIHRMHIEILNIAYKYLLSLNEYNIICGFISPSADCYVIHKQPPLIPYNLRCEMIETAIKEYNNENRDNNNLKIFLHKWEGTHDYFIDFPDVIEEIQYQLNNYFKGIKIQVLYVCGMDLFLKCYYSLTKNVIAIDRKPYKNKKFESIPKNLVYLIEDDKCGPFSSTDIRKAYKKGDKEAIKIITFPEVAEMVFKFYDEKFK